MENLIDNIYSSVGDRVFRQCVGIHMGIDYAPLLANLFLFYYEYKYMKRLIKTNFGLAKRFTHTMRYINDFLALNNDEFEHKICDIYPPELEVKHQCTSCMPFTSADQKDQVHL